MIVLVLFCLIGSFPITFNISDQSLQQKRPNQSVLASGENWLAGWQYRQKMNFWEVAGAGTNYTFKIKVYYGSGVSGLKYTYLDSKCETDFDDIRFTDNDGDTELDYYRSYYVDSSYAIFWFKLLDDSSSGTVEAYIYYGNNGASYTGDGLATFEMAFDDFEDGTTDYWDLVTNGNIHSDRAIGSYSFSDIDVGSATNLILNDSLATQTNPISIGFSVNIQNSLRGPHLIPYTTDGLTEYAGQVKTTYETGTSKAYYFDGAFKAWSASSDDINDDEWQDFEEWIDFNAVDPDCKLWNGLTGTLTLSYEGEEDFHTGADVDPSTLAVDAVNWGNQYNYEAWYDNFFIRKVVYTGEPYVNSFDSEEEAEPPTWHDEHIAIFYFFVLPFDPWVIATLLIIFGLILIPTSTMYLVKGGRSELSTNKMFWALVILLLGIGLFIGGVMP